jgi:hypothetical protein
MKTFIVLLIVGSCLALRTDLNAQGQVIFANNANTAVTNTLTGAAVVSGNTFHVALYVAPDGTTDESVFSLVTETNFFAPGRFSKGTIGIPGFGGGTYVMFQVRVWEMAYGSTYAQAAAAPPMNGRYALLGKSVLIRFQLTMPPSLPNYIYIAGLNPIRLTAQIVPSFFINSIVVAEGTNGTRDAVFTVSLSSPLAGSASVDFATVDGTALAGSDYVATNGTLNFATGETNKTITVTLTPDPAVESDEIFSVQLTNGVGGPVAQGMGTCLITEVRVVGMRMDIAITFNTVVGHHYSVEWTQDFVTWQAVSGAEDIVGVGGNMSIYDYGVNPQSQRFYRARMIE